MSAALTAALSAKKRYRSPVAYVSVDVSLDEFGIDDLRKEIAHRTGTDASDAPQVHEDDAVIVAGSELRRIRMLLLCGQRDAALDAMQDFLRDALGTAL